MNPDDLTFDELRKEMVKLGILRSDKSESRELQRISE